MPALSRSAFSVFLASFLIIAATAAAQDETPYTAPYSPNLPGAGVNYETRLNAVEDQLRAFTGKVEQLEYALRRQEQMLQRMQGDYEARLSKLETAPPPPTIVTAPPPPKASSPAQAVETPQASEPAAAPNNEPANPETSVRGTLGALKLQGEKVTGAVASPKAPPLPDTPPDYGLTAQEQYDRAFGLLRQANYEEAEKAFKAFIDKNPKDSLMDNAKYWYAETYYVRAKFNEAAAAFAEAYQQNPKGTKAPDSLLKLAMSLASLEKKDDACTTLNALKKDYSNAPSTIKTRADQERSRLKCKK